MEKKTNLTTVQKLNPINKEEEKLKFFFDPLYNPQFEYAEELTEEELAKIVPVSDEYLKVCQQIIDKVIKKYDSESKYLEQVEGALISQIEVEQRMREYLQALGITEEITFNYAPDFIARTSVYRRAIQIRTPIEYRQHSLNGVMHHEFGTHLLRNLNDELQPWHGKRSHYHLSPHLDTEEGLAVIHTYLDNPEKLAWLQALYYVGTYWATQLSFSELFKKLERYVDDKDRRWKITVRMKRGIKDTSQPGSLGRDQVYIRGIFEVVQHLVRSKYQVSDFYLGKISVRDIDLARKVTDTSVLIRMPFFFTLDPQQYRAKVEAFLAANSFSV